MIAPGENAVAELTGAIERLRIAGVTDATIVNALARDEKIDDRLPAREVRDDAGGEGDG